MLNRRVSGAARARSKPWSRDSSRRRCRDPQAPSWLPAAISAREYRVANRRRSNSCGRLVFRSYRRPQSVSPLSRDFLRPTDPDDSSADELRVGVVRAADATLASATAAEGLDDGVARVLTAAAGVDAAAAPGLLSRLTSAFDGTGTFDLIGHTRCLLRRNRRLLRGQRCRGRCVGSLFRGDSRILRRGTRLPGGFPAGMSASFLRPPELRSERESQLGWVQRVGARRRRRAAKKIRNSRHARRSAGASGEKNQ